VQHWGEKDSTPRTAGERLIEWATVAVCGFIAAAQAYGVWLWLNGFLR